MISMANQSWTESIRSNRSWTILSVGGQGLARRRSCVCHQRILTEHADVITFDGEEEDLKEILHI
ncbi:hypothetical protein C5167_044337 [Papaver somniferum]|uniref:Uncharacterized protein n=1 Tax=Papaver somniferum TaxID=3469 RepID=A0A4Y7LAQ1_PAPSO|nr:hypothetical protein C5167_044337 [Papaver somniferum]